MPYLVESKPVHCVGLYGVSQVLFIIILFSNFVLTMSYLLSETDESTVHIGNTTKREDGEGVSPTDLALPLLIASSIMLIASCLIFCILMFYARTEDKKVNLRIRKRSASFKVAMLSWILTGIETILRLVGLFHFQSEALDELDQSNSPWWIVAIYHVLLLIQTTCQFCCMHAYEKNTRARTKGWLLRRKSFLIMMAFMNCYFWVLNVTQIKIIVDLTSPKMEQLLSGSVERIIYTVNRASTLAYHVESAQLFYKFYKEDKEGNETEDEQQQESPPSDEISESSENSGLNKDFVNTSKGKWLGFFLFVIVVSMAGGSFLVRTDATDIHYGATFATVGILVTVFSLTLDTTLPCVKSDATSNAPPTQTVDNQANGNQEDNQENQVNSPNNQQLQVNQVQQQESVKMFEGIITSYLAGEKVGHLRILLFYSICAVSYHFLLTMKIIFNGIEMDSFQPIREGCKGLACISLTVFMLWMSHEDTKLRCWKSLHLMFWTVLTLVFLELIEEAFEHGNSHQDPLKSYALPLAIDFKIYALIHILSDTAAAKNDHRKELKLKRNQPTQPT